MLRVTFVFKRESERAQGNTMHCTLFIQDKAVPRDNVRSKLGTAD